MAFITCPDDKNAIQRINLDKVTKISSFRDQPGLYYFYLDSKFEDYVILKCDEDFLNRELNLGENIFKKMNENLDFLQNSVTLIRENLKNIQTILFNKR